MVRWKLFERFKLKRREPSYEESTQVTSEETIQLETEEEPKESSHAEYHETLYSEDSSFQKKNKISSGQRFWRDVIAIEENVDKIRKSKANKPTSELDKKVDKILSKRQKK